MRIIFFIILIFISSLGTVNFFLKNPILGSLATVLQATPQPFVFAQVRGIEHFAARAILEFYYEDDRIVSLEVTPEVYRQVKGWLSYRRAYFGIPLFYSSDFLFAGQAATSIEVLKFAYCDGPILKEMGQSIGVKKFNLIIQTKTRDDGREWKFEYLCQN